MIEIKPTYNKVVVKIDPDVERTKGGLFIPTLAKAERRSQLGVVTAVGPGRVTENGTLVPCCVSVGDRVMITAYSGAPIQIEEQIYTVMPDVEVICILPKEYKQEAKVVEGV